MAWSAEAVAVLANMAVAALEAGGEGHREDHGHPPGADRHSSTCASPSMAQVRENTESTARQYALADEAVRLGWPRSKVEVIDADLGLSGRSARQPPRVQGARQPGVPGRGRAPSSAWRSPAWPAPRRTCHACWSWPA